jgi:hypothetical protein
VIRGWYRSGLGSVPPQEINEHIATVAIDNLNFAAVLLHSSSTFFAISSFEPFARYLPIVDVQTCCGNCPLLSVWRCFTDFPYLNIFN